MNKLAVLSRLTPSMRAVLEKQNELAGGGLATDGGFEEMRASYLAERLFWNEGGPLLHETRDDVVAGPYGDIPVRYYVPTEKENLPCIIYIHGGGFVVGNHDTHDRIMRTLAAKTGAVVVGVDYHLAPEAKFPSAVIESATVAEYLHEQGATQGIAGNHLSFAGDSGGAHLSLAATLYLRDEKHDSSYIKSLILYYGWFGLKDSSSMRLLGGQWDGLTKADWDYYMNCYFSEADEMNSPYADCFNADLTHDMPACYIAAAEFDPLKDDSITLAAIFEEYGIPYRFELFEGVIHAFLHHSRMLDAARDALEHGATFYREHLER
ncbi:MAG: acetyl esterase [Raoultibacter sp.]